MEANADHAHYRRLRKRGLPAVLVNAAYEDLGFPRVSVDDARAVDHAYSHLRSLGHTQIGLLLGGRDHVPSGRKLAAYEALRREHSPSGSDFVERAMFTMEGGQAAGHHLIERGATGIICASDVLALGVVRAARKEGLSVPGDVSIIGFDDSPLMTCTDPPLTTVRQPIEAMGRDAVELLISQISGSLVSSEELLFEPELVVRASTGPVSVKALKPSAA
jgi:DNA-binding LacI/PurR family transcriptional regulator